MHGSKVMLCIKKRDERMDGRMPQKHYATQTSSKLGHKNQNFVKLGIKIILFVLKMPQIIFQFTLVALDFCSVVCCSRVLFLKTEIDNSGIIWL